MRASHLLALSITVALVACDPPVRKPAEGTAPATDAAAGAAKPGDAVVLVGANGKYVSCEVAKPGPLKATLICDRPEPGEWEKFLLVDMGSGNVALKAANGKYVSADRTRNGLLVSDRDAVGEWETFTLVDAPNGKKALKAASNGRFVSSDLSLKGDSLGRLWADRPEAGEWEAFSVLVAPK